MEASEERDEPLTGALAEMRRRVGELERAELERKQAEEALRESEERYRKLVELSPLTIAVHSGGKVVFVNPAGLRLIGASRPEEVLGKPALDFVHPDFRATVQERMQELSQQAALVPPIEEKFVRLDGRMIDVEVAAMPLTYRGQPAVQVVVSDVTERVQAEEALRRSLEEAARGHGLLLALSRAAQAVVRARTAVEVYCAIGEQVAGLGYNATIFTLTEDRAHLIVSYLSYDPALLRSAEKLTGLAAPGYRFPLTPGGLYERTIVREEAAFIAQDDRPIIEALPAAIRPLADQLRGLLGLDQSIFAPLVVHGEVRGLLSVAGDGLTEDDVPAVSAFANQAAIAIENAQLMEQVVRQRRDLERLSAQLIDAQEAERGRISRELHDEIGQALTAISINLAEMEKERTSERLAETRTLVDDTLEQARVLALDLRPSLLDDLGLVPALRWYVNRYAQRLDISVDLEVPGPWERLPPEMATALFRVVQEALTNVARHARATQVYVRLQRSSSSVAVTIEDDGQGFDVGELARGPQPHGVGLIGMRERVALLGGRFRIESHPGQGTQLWVEIPLEGRGGR